MASTADTVEEIASLARKHSLDVAAAESLTSGSVATRLGAGTDASVWFRGAIVAYSEDAKFSLLGVDPGPVVTASCATQMAQGVSRLFESQVGVAVTGVGGPDPVEGHPPGTVFVAVAVRDQVTCRELHLDGGPEDVLESSTSSALALLLEKMREI
jgi:nicotinamide-nucleotide amidase